MASPSSSHEAQPTRLLFTSLHPSVAAEHLRTHLAQCPPAPPAITDLKVVTRPDGTSRCIAFAGFRRHADADRVRQWASGAWVAGDRGGSRIKVDWAKDVRSLSQVAARDAAPPPAKRVRLAGKVSDRPSSHDVDSRFQDFLAVMAPARAAPAPAVVAQPSTPALPVRPSSPPLTPATRPAPASPPAPVAPRVDSSSDQTNVDSAAGDEALSDAEYLARRMKRRIGELDEEPEITETDGGAEPGRDWEQAEEAPTVEATESRAAAEVHIPLDAATGASKGLAYVTFRQSSCAVEAYAALDGRTFQGRLLHILPAVGRVSKASREGSKAGVKAERLEARKQTAGQSFSWATLYLNANAALSAVADRLGVAKSALLDPSASDPAVKVALAEAHTLGEIKQYFENVGALSSYPTSSLDLMKLAQEGVNLTAFAQAGPRSATCILIKNLPYGTTVPSLSALLAPFGHPSRLLVPPSGTIAVVEMPDASSASEAWRNLVYKQFGGNVLYLEKAPASLWAVDRVGPSSAAATDSLPPVTISTQPEPMPSSGTGAGATLFVKNLNFDTTSTRLQGAFQHLPGFVFARVQTKPDPRHSGRTLSMGYGFVGFRTTNDAASAKAARQDHVLDGHQLDIRFAQRGAAPSEPVGTASKARETTTKLLVKNVPFEATRKELRQLFRFVALSADRVPSQALYWFDVVS
ncbi:SPOSA6832_03550 [Sporobolomyces salmonicolor]|uniref:SPOSA6832_03550-mRNA-1:cds n=1 Tax=Sporidiobolus salmonicolor TaxID=5005 RepID=A0A0D6EPK2_SPOSA|nr:SPOSA6832_03550 [Sporobolomyces salmonicolor]